MRLMGLALASLAALCCSCVQSGSVCTVVCAEEGAPVPAVRNAAGGQTIEADAPVARPTVQIQSDRQPSSRFRTAEWRALTRLAHAQGWFPRRAAISPRWTTIVIHHSATDRGNAEVFDSAHRARGWDELGYHFVIGNGSDSPEGSVEVGPRWRKQKHGAHCRTDDNYFNEHGIGICLVGDFSHEPPSLAQMRSLHQLLRFLMIACDIPAERITSHRCVTHKTACPGACFPLTAVRAEMAAPITASHLP
jgi:hypothetical protein